MSVHTVRAALLAALALVCVAMPATASAASSHRALEAGIVRQMNKVRAGSHVPKLRSSGGLARAADAHSRAMLRRNVLEHGAFAQRVRRYVHVRGIGENLAW